MQFETASCRDIQGSQRSRKICPWFLYILWKVVFKLIPKESYHLLHRTNAISGGRKYHNEGHKRGEKVELGNLRGKGK